MSHLRPLSVVLLLLMVLVPVLPVGAQTDLDVARQKAEEAARRADEARDLAEAARRRADTVALELDSAVGRLERIQEDITAVAQRLAAAQQEADILGEEVQRIAVARYLEAGRPRAELARADTLEARVVAGVLAEIATYGIDDDVDRYREVTDDLEADRNELRLLEGEQEAAVAELRATNQRFEAELAEMEAQLAVVEEQEAVWAEEVARLEEEERQRLEAERRRKEAERQKRLAEERRAREAEAERQRQAEEAARRATSTTTTSPPPTTVPATAPAGGNPEGEGGQDPAATTTVPSPTTAPAPVLVGTDGFLCPIAGPTSFADTWGAPRSGGRRHKGVDMFAPRGTPVVAPVSGVVRQRDNRLGGHTFYLNGDDGNVYYGAHLDSYGASGRVEAGTVVGTVGNSGNARYSSTHLHFEIKPGGGPSVNPTPQVRAACG